MEVSDKLFQLRRRTAPSFVVECVRNLEARASQLVFSATIPEHMFWVLVPALRSLHVSTERSRLSLKSEVNGRDSRLYVLSSFDEDVGDTCLCRWRRHLLLGRHRLCLALGSTSLHGLSLFEDVLAPVPEIRGSEDRRTEFLRLVRRNGKKRESCLTKRLKKCCQNAEFKCKGHVYKGICRETILSWVTSRFATRIRIYTKAVARNGKIHMQNYRLFKLRSVMEVVNWECDDALDVHVWDSELTCKKLQRKNLKRNRSPCLDRGIENSRKS